MRQVIALSLCFSLFAAAQELSIVPIKPKKPLIVRPYFAPEVPPVRLNDSSRLSQLIRGGTLYLTVQDAIALTLENNIDLEVSRYNPIAGEWRVTRAEAGGALPGVPTGASQAGSVASGQGVAGSQAAAGVSAPGGGSSRGASSNATISQIGPVTQNLDPAVQDTSSFSHTSTPQSNTQQSGIPNLITNTRGHTVSIQEGFLTGGLVNLTYNERYLQENALSDLLNPSVAPSLSLSVQQNLLRGFGIAVNARTITVAKANLGITDLNFKNQVVGLVAQVLTLYYNLSSTYDDLNAKRNTNTVAATFFDNVKQQIDLGSVAPPEAINAEQQLVTAKQAVKDAETTLAQQELRLKNYISRNGSADPLLKATRIVPVDKIVIPPQDELPPLAELVQGALASRPDLIAAQANEKNTITSSLGTTNGLLPTLTAFAAESHAGLAGDPQRVANNNGGITTPDPYFVGGIGTGLGQIVRRNFPTERVGAFLQASIGNHQAQADQIIDVLSLRQSQLQMQKDRNQVQVDIMNYMVAMQQARARYDAAIKNRQLQDELLKAEQTRFSLGASTPYNVIRAQQDFVTSQYTETSAKVSYSNARIALDQVAGRTLDVVGVKLEEARTGRVLR